MGDTVALNTNQIINGLAVLLSFFVGYKYALKKNNKEVILGTDIELPGTTAPKDVQVTPLFTSLSFNYKMVLVVRNDLKMGKGKIAAQCGHAAVGAYQKAVRIIPNVVKSWDNGGCAKIALKVESESQLMAIKKSADARNLNTCLIRDAGRTQIEPNTKTVLAIGPAAVEAIDLVTGHLRLL